MTSNPNFQRNVVLANLSQGVHWVKFFKLDGERRCMPATLDPEHIPINKRPKGNRPSHIDTIRAFVTDIQEWRSFKLDNIISITGEEV